MLANRFFTSFRMTSLKGIVTTSMIPSLRSREACRAKRRRGESSEPLRPLPITHSNLQPAKYAEQHYTQHNEGYQNIELVFFKHKTYQRKKDAQNRGGYQH